VAVLLYAGQVIKRGFRTETERAVIVVEGLTRVKGDLAGLGINALDAGGDDRGAVKQ
jgi:hypothetical protein